MFKSKVEFYQNSDFTRKIKGVQVRFSTFTTFSTVENFFIKFFNFYIFTP